MLCQIVLGPILIIFNAVGTTYLYDCNHVHCHTGQRPQTTMTRLHPLTSKIDTTDQCCGAVPFRPGSGTGSGYSQWFPPF